LKQDKNGEDNIVNYKIILNFLRKKDLSFYWILEKLISYKFSFFYLSLEKKEREEQNHVHSSLSTSPSYPLPKTLPSLPQKPIFFASRKKMERAQKTNFSQIQR
jgi:hypothetical protein